jgi:hypothetical protein
MFKHFIVHLSPSFYRYLNCIFYTVVIWGTLGPSINDDTVLGRREYREF